MDSSNDSSSEENENLREALDQSMFSSASCVSFQSKQSLRDQKADRNYKNNILNVTPEFQSFVAKRLSELLDKTIKECHKEVDLPASKSSGGIRLFKESKRLLKDRKFVDPFDPNAEVCITVQSKKRKNDHEQVNDEDESVILENAKSVAVSPTWILEKRGTFGWSKPKGDSVVYRKNKNNELELVDHPS